MTSVGLCGLSRGRDDPAYDPCHKQTSMSVFTDRYGSMLIGAWRARPTYITASLTWPHLLHFLLSFLSVTPSAASTPDLEDVTICLEWIFVCRMYNPSVRLPRVQVYILRDFFHFLVVFPSFWLSSLTFYARRHGAYMPRQFHPPVCLSHACFVSKRLNISSKFFHCLIGPSFFRDQGLLHKSDVFTP